jgi:UDPglucose 6-dehydrogenase
VKRPVIGFAGLTHLGLNSAVASAARGFDVIGYHDDKALVNQIKKGVPHVTEPQLSELMREHGVRLTFTSQIEDLLACDIVYISVDVPTDDEGRSDLTPIRAMIDRATATMRPHALLAILCQVPPGFTRQLEWPANRLIYQVETLVFGRAIERAIYPERFIIGVAEPGAPLPEVLVTYLGAFGCPLLPMRYESAELAKISINICLVASVSVANTLAEVCERIGADWAEIAPALKLDKRIGQHAYLSPGLGIAGGNLERDLATIILFAERYETDAGVVSAFVANSRHRRDWVLRTLRKLVLDERSDARVALLGLTYKENTHSLKNSPAIALANALAPRKLTAYDPVAVPDAGGAHVMRKATALDAIDGADVLAVMTAWPEFQAITTDQLEARMRGRTVLDPYRVLDGTSLTEAGFTYATLGVPIVLTEYL